MTRAAFLRFFEKTVAAAPGSLTPGQRLDRVENWDSTAVLDFIALADEQFSVSLPGEAILRCATVGELIGLLGEHVTE